MQGTVRQGSLPERCFIRQRKRKRTTNERDCKIHSSVLHRALVQCFQQIPLFLSLFLSHWQMREQDKRYLFLHLFHIHIDEECRFLSHFTFIVYTQEHSMDKSTSLHPVASASQQGTTKKRRRRKKKTNQQINFLSRK